MTWRAQVSLDFYTAKLLSSKLNMSSFYWNNLQGYESLDVFDKNLHGEDLFFIPVCSLWLVITKDKGVTADGVSVEVTKEEYFA